jgi:hypothetical protein
MNEWIGYAFLAAISGAASIAFYIIYSLIRRSIMISKAIDGIVEESKLDRTAAKELFRKFREYARAEMRQTGSKIYSMTVSEMLERFN